MKRLFIAIHLRPSDTLLGLLSQLKTRLGHERINWVKPENMHLTLKFLGETPDFKLAAISNALRETVESHRPFGYAFDRTGIFGSRHNPRVLWLGMQSHNQHLHGLAEAIIDAMDAHGFVRDRQNFVPHLTLGRIHRLADKKLFSGIVDAIPQRVYLQGMVEEVNLYESILLPQGPRYSVVERFSLPSPASAAG